MSLLLCPPGCSSLCEQGSCPEDRLDAATVTSGYKWVPDALRITEANEPLLSLTCHNAAYWERHNADALRMVGMTHGMACSFLWLVGMTHVKPFFSLQKTKHPDCKQVFYLCCMLCCCRALLEAFGSNMSPASLCIMPITPNLVPAHAICSVCTLDWQRCPKRSRCSNRCVCMGGQLCGRK